MATVAIALVGWLAAGPLWADGAADSTIGADVARSPANLADLPTTMPDAPAGAAATANRPVTQVRVIEAANPEAGELIRSAIDMDDIVWQRAKTAIADYSERARKQILKPKEELTQQDFAQARHLLTAAKDILKNNEDVGQSRPAEYKALGAELADLLEFINNAEEEWNVYRVAIDKQIAEDQQREALRQERERKNRRIAELMGQAQDARVEKDFPNAIRLLEEILKIEPNHRQAQWMREDMQTINVINQQEAIDANKSLWERKSLLSVREGLVPYDDAIVYPRPELWHKITEQRKPYEAGTPPESPANQRVREIMQRTVPEIRFQLITFEKALDFLRDLQRVNINPNWGAMEQLGILPTTEVSLQLRDVTFETALRELLAKVAGREDVLDYMIRDGVVKISTRDDLATIKYILVYDVRDLLHPLTDFRVPRMKRGDDSGDDDDDNGGGGGLFGDDDDAAGDDDTNAEEDRAAKVTAFLDLIRTTVLPDSWAPTGDANVLETDGLLVVKQTANGHRDLAKLLAQLREHTRMQVTIEVRFLTLDTGFLEDIGVDLDFIFNMGNTDSKGLSRIPVATNTFGRGTLDPATGAVTGGTITGASVLSGLTSITDSSLIVAGHFMDDLQVDFFLRATQAHAQRSSLNSLRVTLLNGHEAYVAVEEDTDYVSDLTPTVAEAATAYNPDTSELVKGISFGVRATVSADRRYVIMTVYPTLRDDSLQEDPFSFVDPTVTVDPVTGEETETGGVQIQLGRRNIQEVRTTVMVPDRGTLLLGGQRTASEFEIETGVPILSKIPGIKRLFTSRNFAKRETTLLILIRPEIWIPEEIEP